MTSNIVKCLSGFPRIQREVFTLHCSHMSTWALRTASEIPSMRQPLGEDLHRFRGFFTCIRRWQVTQCAGLLEWHKQKSHTVSRHFTPQSVKMETIWQAHSSPVARYSRRAQTSPAYLREEPIQREKEKYVCHIQQPLSGKVTRTGLFSSFLLSADVDCALFLLCLVTKHTTALLQTCFSVMSPKHKDMKTEAISRKTRHLLPSLHW